MKTAIVFFSRAGKNWSKGKVVSLEEGNTKRAAEFLSSLLSADLIPVLPKTPYSDDYDTCCEEAKREHEQNLFPPLSSFPSFAEYDVIYLGYPIYWGSFPRPIATLLSSQDFTGKTIYPFSTHEGSGLGSSVSDIRKYAKGSQVLDPLPIPGSLVVAYEERMRAWVKSHLSAKSKNKA